MRKLIGLIALLAALGVFVVSASAASASKSQCLANEVCVWSGFSFTGQFSWWAESDKGCHNHSGNPKLRTVWNRTGYTIMAGGWENIGPNTWDERFGSDPLTGEICWPV